MTTNIGTIQAMVAYTASESASGQASSGMAAVGRLDAERKTNEKVMKQKEAEIADLTAQLDGISNMNGEERFFRGMFGDDCGMGGVTDGMGRATAEMKRAQAEAEIQSAKIEMRLRELQDVGPEQAARLEAHGRVYQDQINILNLMGL